MLAFPYQHKGVKTDELIMYFGGCTGPYTTVADIQKYDGASKARTVAYLSSQEFKTCASSIGDTAYVFGINQKKAITYNGNNSFSNEVYNKIEKFSGASFSSSVTSIESTVKRCRGSASNLNGTIYVFGGDGNYSTFDNNIEAPIGYNGASKIDSYYKKLISSFSTNKDKVGAFRSSTIARAVDNGLTYTILDFGAVQENVLQDDFSYKHGASGKKQIYYITPSSLNDDEFYLNGWYFTRIVNSTNGLPSGEYDYDDARFANSSSNTVTAYFRSYPTPIPSNTTLVLFKGFNNNTSVSKSTIDSFDGVASANISAGTTIGHDMTTTAYNGNIYVIGGSVLPMYPLLASQGTAFDSSFPAHFDYLNTEDANGYGYFKSIKTFDGTSLSTSYVNMQYKTARTCSGELNGNIYIFSGRNRTTAANNSQKYVPLNGTCSMFSAANYSYPDGNCNKLGGKLRVTGGAYGGSFGSIIYSFDETAMSSTNHTALNAGGKSSATISKST